MIMQFVLFVCIYLLMLSFGAGTMTAVLLASIPLLVSGIIVGVAFYIANRF